MTKPKRHLLLLLSASMLLVVGCAGPARVDEPHPVWPPPPEPPRIIHRQTIRANTDFGRTTGFASLGELLTGRLHYALIRPSGVAQTDDDRLLVADRERQGVFIFHTRTGRADFLDAIGELNLQSPVDLVRCGDVYAVSDSGLNRVLLFTPDGKLVRELAKPGGFKRPAGLAYDPRAQRVYVVDTLAAEVCAFDLDGRMTAHFGAPGGEPGQLNFPTHITIDNLGRILVVDSMNFRVQTFNAQGRVVSTFGSQGNASGFFGVPKGIGVDREGHIYIADSYFCTVQVFDADGRFLLAFGEPGGENGQFQVPTTVMVDADNRIYVCDSHNSRVQVFEYIGMSDHESITTPNN